MTVRCIVGNRRREFGGTRAARATRGVNRSNRARELLPHGSRETSPHPRCRAPLSLRRAQSSRLAQRDVERGARGAEALGGAAAGHQFIAPRTRPARTRPARACAARSSSPRPAPARRRTATLAPSRPDVPTARGAPHVPCPPHAPRQQFPLTHHRSSPSLDDASRSRAARWRRRERGGRQPG